MRKDTVPPIVYLPPSLSENHTLSIYTTILQKKNYDIAIGTLDSLNYYLPWKFADFLIPPTIIKESTFWKRLNEINPDFDNFNVRKAFSISKQTHSGQMRRNNHPYFEEHILPVALYYLISSDLLEIPIKENLLIACLLHDSVEDSEGKVVVYKKDAEIPDAIILEEIFNPHICETVKKLTKINMQDRELKLKIYAEQIKSSPDALLLKCIDRLLNLASDIEAFETKNPDKVLRYLDETRKYFFQFYDLIDPYYKVIAEIIMEVVSESIERARVKALE